jgi:cytochrome c553
MMKKIVILAVVLTFLGLSPGAFAGDVAAGKVKAAEKRCFICHGKDGISMGNPLWPNLKGQKAGYLAKQLKAYRSDQRKDEAMNKMAKDLSDTDIENLAAYFHSLK